MLPGKDMEDLQYINMLHSISLMKIYNRYILDSFPIFQPEGDGEHTTMESAVEDIMDKLTTGTDDQVRKYSQGFTLGNNKVSKGLSRKQTISALRNRNQTYKARKATMKVDCILCCNSIWNIESIKFNPAHIIC